MAIQKPEWFKVDPAKFLSDAQVDAMSTLELGACFRLLCRQWLDGFIPDDIHLLARLCRLDAVAMGEAWVTLCPFFPVIEPGKRANRFMFIEREKIVADLERRSDEGFRAARKRWDEARKNKDAAPNGSPMPDPMQDQTRPDQTRADQKEGSKEPLSKSPGKPDDMDDQVGSKKAAEVVGAWNTMAEGTPLPKARLTPKRAKEIQTRLRERGWLEDFGKACAFIRGAPWYHGQNERQWVATLDYLLRPGKATELAEKGTAPKTLNGGRHGTRSPQHRAEVDEAYARTLAEQHRPQPEPIGDDPALLGMFETPTPDGGGQGRAGGKAD